MKDLFHHNSPHKIQAMALSQMPPLRRGAYHVERYIVFYSRGPGHHRSLTNILSTPSIDFLTSSAALATYAPSITRWSALQLNTHSSLFTSSPFSSKAGTTFARP